MPGLFGSSGSAKTARTQELVFAGDQKQIIDRMKGEGATDSATGRSALNDAGAFFKALLTGDKQTVMGALSPEINTLTSQYQTSQKATSEFAPRGGGRTASMATGSSDLSTKISNLVEGARQTGATGETEIGKILSSLGLAETGLAADVSGTARGQSEAELSNAQGQQQQTGSAIGSLLALLLGGL